MDDLIAQLDDHFKWDDLFVDDPNFFDPSSTLPNDSLNFSVDDIEQLLMNDEDDDHPHDQQEELSNGFISDILLDSPLGSTGSPGEVVDDVSDGGSNKNFTPSPSPSPEEEEKDEEEEEEEKNDSGAADDLKENNDSTDADDPLSKKRKRQLRNRDAAVRSRERKKMYVRDLEMKSRYFEGECKRLGMLLQCYLAENQALRLSLQHSKAFDASVTKQESAVLLLESLLLGSLLWFLGIMCLLIRPSPFQPSLGGAVHLESERRLNLTPEKVATKFCDRLVLETYLVGKRCKASRSRMKISLLAPEVLA